MKTAMPVAICLFTFSCSTLSPRYQNTNWDVNGDNQLNNYEFVNGYLGAGLFKEWTGSDAYLNFSQFLELVFNEIDLDDNGLIDQQEFDFKAGLYCSRIDAPYFRDWDDDRDQQVSFTEMSAHGRDDVIPAWDKVDDDRISDMEVASEMFSRCDLDNNSQVDAIELAVWAENH